MQHDNDTQKLRILLDHWIEHNAGHAQEFKEWAEKARQLGHDKVSEDMMQAARQVAGANEHLLAALEGLKEA